MSASLALAPPAPTSPARGTLQLGADSPAPARWLQTLGHARRSGIRTRGRGRARKAPASSRPPLAAASRGRRNPEPQPGRAERRRRLPFSPPASPEAPRGPALKRAGNLVYRPRSTADRAFVWKVSISGSVSNVCLVTLALGRPAGKGGSPGSDLVSEADRAGDFCAFVLIFGNLSYFSSLARCRACPDLAPATTAPGCRSERFPVGLPPSLADFATPRSRRIDLGVGEEGGGGAANTRTQALTCSRAERRKPEPERTAGAISPPGSEHGAPGALPCAWAAALLVWGSPPLPASGVRGRQDHAAEGVPDLHAAHRSRGKRRAGPGLAHSPSPAPGRRASRPAGPLRAAGKPWWKTAFQTGRLEGEEEVELLLPLVTPARRAALGGAVETAGGFWGGRLPESRLLGIRMRQRDLVAPSFQLRK